MDALFRLILTTSLYASIVGIILLVLKSFVKNRINPRWHYILWTILLLKLLVPFGPESALSLFNKVPNIPQNTDFSQIYEDYHQSYTTVVQSGDKTRIPTSWAVQDSSLQLAAAAEKALPYVWFAGTLLILGWLIYTGISLNRKISKATMPVPESIEQIFAVCKQKMGITSDIAIVLQNVIGTPSIFGLLRPRILLSPDALKMESKDLSFVLLHELAHYRRKDLLANYLLLLLQTIHWFNPVIWYCFKRIRQDMELAADELVLTQLEAGEQKEYGKALLAVIEQFSLPRLAPRLIGMVDDKKSIEKRIRSIKMVSFFRSRRKAALLFSVLCIAVSSILLLTSGLSNDADTKAAAAKKSNVLSVHYDAAKLLKFKSPYVGDNSNTVNLLNNLPLADARREVSLQTEKQPYGMTVNYDFSGSILSTEQIGNYLGNNAAMIFALIDNVDQLELVSRMNTGTMTLKITREPLQSSYPQKITEYARDENSLQTLINSLGVGFAVYPEKYTPAMSSTPGIRILTQYGNAFDKVTYTTSNGSFLTWDKTTGKITGLGKKAELGPGVPVYWSALDSKSNINPVKQIQITASIYYKNTKTAEKKMMINNDDGMYSPVLSDSVVIAEDARLESQNPKNLDQAVSLAVLSQSKNYASGEKSTEGHIILDTEKKDGMTKVYTIASYGAFGFENGIFTKTSGSGAIATVISFSGDENTGYSLVTYQEPKDGSLNLESKKEMFPKRLWDKVLSEQNYYRNLVKQQENQAQEYLRKINRVAEVNADYVEKQLPNLNAEASNKIFGEYAKNDTELNNFPYWIGTRELIQDGTRYIYETSQGKSDDGKDILWFVKTNREGDVVKKYTYEIIGSQVRLLPQTSDTK